MKIKKHIPNFLTCCNILFGCLAVIEIFQGQLDHVIYFTLLSALVDFFDGFAARLLKAYSNIGKDLDSLADMISFGLVPSLLVYQMLYSEGHDLWMCYLPLSIAILSGVRLAKFNNDERQTDAFYGLPTPANAMFFCSLPLLEEHAFFATLLANPYFLVVISLLMSIILVADIKMIALKFKGFGWEGNQEKYLLILLSLIFFLTFKWYAFPFIIVVYVILSILVTLFKREKQHPIE